MDQKALKNDLGGQQKASLARILMSGQGSRIDNGAVIAVLLVALIFDLLSLIPFVGDVAGPVFWIGMSTYLWTKGCGLINGRRLATTLISTVGEMIPVIQELPLIFAGAIIVLAMVRFEDKTGVSVMKGVSGGKALTGGASASSALNHDGVRLPQDPEASKVASRNANTQPLNIQGVRYPS